MAQSLFQWISKRTEDLFLSIRARVILSYLTIVAIGFFYFTWRMSHDVRPRYLAAEEEIMVDMANVLASSVEQTWSPSSGPDLEGLNKAAHAARRREFSAGIYDVTKSTLDLHFYITDTAGRVIFDSQGKAVGQDYSRWNDVYLTLQGKYGARSTRDDEEDEESSVLYVGAPIRHEGQIVGVLTLAKPQTSMADFMERTRKQIFVLASVAAAGVALMGVLFSAWITYPIRNLIAYAKSIRDGRPAKFPTLGHSEIRTLGLALEEMRDALEGKDYVHRYVQTLTHEIKSPVAAIQGAAELLQEEMPACDRRRFLANIQSETGRIQEAIDSLLLLASVESKKSLEHATELDLSELLVRAKERLSGRAALKAIQILLGFPEMQRQTSGAPAYGDAFLLERAFLNLLENAVAFSPQGAEVRVQLEFGEHLWRIMIEDSGPGIPDYAAGRIFERFYSLPRPDTGKKSSGLGLAFVKEVALLHGGSVELLNRPGGVCGSQAIFSMPAGS